MKKIFQLLALFVCLTVTAQNCPGDKIELLNGKTLKVLPISEALQKYGYKSFFSDADLKKVYKKSGSNTAYDALVEKEFKMVSYEPYVTSLGKSRFKLLLENSQTGKIYYDYSPEHCSLFPFETIGGIDLPADFYCNTIITGKTKGGINFYQTNGADGVMFKRFFEANNIEDVLQVNTPSISSGEKGVSVLLSNNVKIERPNADIITIENGIGGTAHAALITLTKEETALIKNNEIVKSKIGNVESDVKAGKTLISYYNCMIAKPYLASAVKTGAADCNLDTKFNEKTSETSYVTPDIDGVILKKIKDIHNNVSYIGLVEVQSKTKIEGTGIQLLFENGDFINDPKAKLVEDKLADGSFSYIAVFIIEKKDIYSFALSKIKGGKVATALKSITEADEIQKMASCLIDK